MEPLKTHGTSSPQQALTRLAGGCPSGPRPVDLMQGGHEGANPYASQRAATPTTDDQSMNTDLDKTLTKLEIFKKFVDKAHLHGFKTRPLNLDTEERCLIVLNTLYPNGIPNNIEIQNKKFKYSITKFLSKCETLYNKSKRNFKRFCEKNKDWLSSIFDIEIPKLNIEENPLSQQNIIELNTAQFPSTNPSTSITAIQRTSKPQELEPSRDFDIPHSSTSYENLSDRQKRRARKNLEVSLEDEPSKIIKVVSQIVTNETGEKLNKSSAQELEFVINECLKTPTRPKKLRLA